MKTILFFLTLALSLFLFEQNSQAQKNVVKLNLTPLIIRDVTVQYERVFLEKFSVALGMSYMLNGPQPSYIPKIPFVDGLKFSGFSITPEIRIYPHILKGAPRGLYLAPYLKYSRYSLDANVAWSGTFDVPTPNSIPTAPQSVPVTMSQTFNLKGSFSGMGAGLLIGKQMIIADHISIDLYLIGAHIGTNANLDVSSPITVYPENCPPEVKTAIEKSIQDKLDEIKLPPGIPGTVKASVMNQTARVQLEKIPFLGVRFIGFNIGFAF